MKRSVMVAALAAVLGTTAAGVAQANTVVLDLTQNGCSGDCFGSGVTSLGAVTVDAVGGSLDFTVDLTNGAIFNANGNGQHNALVFGLDQTGLTISDLSAGFGLPTEKYGKTTKLDPGPFSEAPFSNKWAYAIDYVGGAKQGHTPGALSFTVSDAAHDLTLADLVAGDLYDSLKIYAAADVYANDTTGNVGAVMVPTTGVPEPATWALLLLGVGMIGAALRRRSGQAAPVDAA